jgi:hypothetical protein
MTKHCPRCLEPLDANKALIATVNEQELCAVCGAAAIGADCEVDVDLAQGLMATILGQARGSAFIASYVQRQAAKATGEKPPPPMDPLVAQAIGLAPLLAEAAVALLQRQSGRRQISAALKKSGRRQAIAALKQKVQRDADEAFGKGSPMANTIDYAQTARGARVKHARPLLDYTQKAPIPTTKKTRKQRK